MTEYLVPTRSACQYCRRHYPPTPALRCAMGREEFFSNAAERCSAHIPPQPVSPGDARS